VSRPARWGTRRTVLDLLDRLGLARTAVHGYELALAARSKLGSARRTASNGLPVPPARLRTQVGPLHADVGFFLGSGLHERELIQDLVVEAGSSVEDLDAVLDFGCGCGRTLRHWVGLPGTQLFGCDIDPRMVEWCRENLLFADVRVTQLVPPLPYPDSSFDLVYAFSVFTHLPEDLQHAWMRECLRVLKPGGHLLISTLGEYYASLERLNEAEHRSFLDGELVVLYEGSPGTSLCSAYHPADYVRHTLAADFELVTFRPAASDGRHDIHFLRKPARKHAAVGS